MPSKTREILIAKAKALLGKRPSQSSINQARALAAAIAYKKAKKGGK